MFDTRFVFLLLIQSRLSKEQIPIFLGDKLHGLENISNGHEANHRPAYSPWSPCSSTCAPAYRVRKKLTCSGDIEEACSEVKPCEQALPECGTASYAAEIHLLTGDTSNFDCPPHPRDPALRLSWYRWMNGSWGLFQPYDDTRVFFRPYTFHMILAQVEELDQGSYKCVLLYPDGNVKTARYYHIKVARNFTLVKEALVALGVLLFLLLIGCCVRGFCLPGAKATLPCFKVDPGKSMSELYYSRLKDEGIIK